MTAVDDPRAIDVVLVPDQATIAVARVANARLAPIITDSLRIQINSRTLQQLVSGDRSELIAEQQRPPTPPTVDSGMG